MPELPEVETITQILKREIQGKKILNFYIFPTKNTKRIFRGHKSQEEMEKTLKGKTIISVERIGKNILFHLSGRKILAIHLMMTGALLLNPKNYRPHDRWRMKLSGGIILVFNDIRTFGRTRIIDPHESLVGPDALSVSKEVFKNIFLKRKGAVKNLLLDQRRIAGIGNIYADEILWYAGINPRRSARTLLPAEILRLHRAMRSTLVCAIRHGGSSARNYRKPDGSTGGYYPFRKVYRRTGEKCERDDGIISRIVLGQRSTHFCPTHQK